MGLLETCLGGMKLKVILYLSVMKVLPGDVLLKIRSLCYYATKYVQAKYFCSKKKNYNL